MPARGKGKYQIRAQQAREAVEQETGKEPVVDVGMDAVVVTGIGADVDTQQSLPELTELPELTDVTPVEPEPSPQPERPANSEAIGADALADLRAERDMLLARVKTLEAVIMQSSMSTGSVAYCARIGNPAEVPAEYRENGTINISLVNADLNANPELEIPGIIRRQR